MFLARQRLSKLAIASVFILLCESGFAASNICNSGIGGTGIDDGIGGTGLSANSGIGGTGIDAGIGGTGKQANSGIGGTGKQANSGIGGTGKQADSGVGGTGIVGIITGFASVCVNGIEVHYDDKTKVDMDGQLSAINALDVGQLVAIESIENGNMLKAERISVSHVIVGKIDQINYAQNSMQILGQTVHYNSNTLGAADLKLNQTIKISGLHTNSSIYALRVDLAAPNTPSSIVGAVSPAGDIHGVKISVKLNVGQQSQVSGHWDGKILRATKVQESAVQQVLRSVEYVVIQDLAPAKINALNIQNLRMQNQRVQNQHVQTDANTKISGNNNDAEGNQTVIVRGKIDHVGNIAARSVEYSGKENLLERGGSKQRPHLPEPTRHNGKDNGTSNNVDHNDVNKVEDGDLGKETSKPERAEKTDKIEKPESLEKPGKVEKPEKLEKPEKVEKPEKIEKPEKVEKPEKIELPEKIIKPEKLELPEIPKH